MEKSRNELILESIISGEYNFSEPQSRNEALLIALGEQLKNIDTPSEDVIRQAVTDWLSENPIGLPDGLEDDVSRNTSARHTHSNKSVLDGITADKVEAWDNGGSQGAGASEVLKYTHVDNVTYSNGYYIDASGQVVSSASADDYTKKVITTTLANAIPVTPGDRYRFTFASKSASRLAQHGAWVDDNGTLVEILFSNNGIQNNVVKTVPVGATKLIISAWIGGKSYFEKVELLSESEIDKITYANTKANLTARLKEHQEKQLNYATPTFAPFDKGYVTIINDDMRGQADTMFQICNAVNIPFSVAGIIDDRGLTSLNDTGRSYQVVFEDIVANGGEILAHHATQMTQEMIEDYDTCYEHFATVKKRFADCGFSVNGCILAGGTGQVVGSPITDMWVRYFYQYSDLYGIPGYGFPYYGYRTPLSQKTLAQAKEMIDEAVQNKTWVRFYLHTWDDFPEDDFRELIDYIASYDDDLLGKVTYKTMYDKFIIYKVKQPRVLSVAVSNPIYNNGSITVSNASLHYSDGSVEDVTENVSFDYSKVNISVPGWYPVKVSYNGFICTAPCRVVGSGRVVINEGTFGSANIGSYTVWSDGLLQLKNNGTYKTGMGNAMSVNDVPWSASMESITSFDPDTTGTNGYFFNYYIDYMLSGSNITHFEQRNAKLSKYMFANCLNLKSVLVIGNQALATKEDTTVFENCPNFDTIAFSEYGNQNTRYGYTMHCLPTSIRNLYIGGNNAPEANWFGSVPNRASITDVYVSWNEGDPQDVNKGTNAWGVGTQATVHYNSPFALS